MTNVSNDWVDLAVEYTRERMRQAHEAAMKEQPDARRVLTYLRGVGAGKFSVPHLASLLGVSQSVVSSVADNLQFEPYSNDDGTYWYIFNADDFEQRRPDQVLQIIEDENRELKTTIERLKAELNQADMDHAETLEKYDLLRIYALAALDVCETTNHTVIDAIEKLLKRGAGIWPAGHLNSLLTDADPAPDYDAPPF